MPDSDDASGASGDAVAPALGSAWVSAEASQWVARAKAVVAEAQVWLLSELAEAWESALPLVERALQSGSAWLWAQETVTEWEKALRV